MSDSEEAEATRALSCLDCGVSLEPHHRFCYNCGTAAPGRATTEAIANAQTVALEENRFPVPEIGRVFADRFVVKKELGIGGMGAVFLVEEKASSLKLALKILKPEFSSDLAARSRFEREVRILARIRHPSIPRIVEWGSYQNSLFFVSQFVEGQDLGEVLEERGAFAPDDAAELIGFVAEALGSAHQAGIIHRDLKPSNIMVSNTGAVFLIDFGVARTVSSELTRLTESGLFIGTPQYMAPEQLDSKRADERSDIYSIGVVLFELLTGELPFHGETPMAIATKHLYETPRSPRRVKPSIPHWMENVILRCLEKDPSSRFWTVNELLTELRRSHSKSRRRKRSMPNGDLVAQDLSGHSPWHLLVSSDREKTGWTSSMSLYYKDNFYKLKSARRPDKENDRWAYAFDRWPENEVMRRVVDYEAEATMQSAKGSLFSKAKKWIGGR